MPKVRTDRGPVLSVNLGMPMADRIRAEADADFNTVSHVLRGIVREHYAAQDAAAEDAKAGEPR